MHDAAVWGWRAGIEQAAHAVHDPNVAMPGPARTGGGSALPMRALIAMASNSVHYLSVFENHSDRPIYLGRSQWIATLDQRIACHSRDMSCTRPGCTAPGYHCEVMHTRDWYPDGAADADSCTSAADPTTRWSPTATPTPP
jgi:hypothetical protein